MKAFTQLIISLDQTNKTNQKLAALKDYLLQANDEDRLWSLALFTGRRPKRKVNSSLLKEWVTEWAGIPSWLFQESYQVVGDIAETIALLLPDEATEQKKESHSLSFYINELIRIGELSNELKKEELKLIYSQLEKESRFVFTKLMSGGWRIGVSQNLISKAISEAFQIDKAIIAHKIMGNWTPHSTTFEELIFSEHTSDELAKPYPFYLAYPITTAEIITDLGPPSAWQAEWKWDGIRGQIIHRKDTISIWSRGEELVTDKYPELEQAATQLPSGCVIDGEILPYKDGAPLSFSFLQLRIGRKNLTKAILNKAPVIFKAYDILEYNGNDIRHKPFLERQDMLSTIIAEMNDPNFQLSEPVNFDTWKELEELRTQSRALKTEGFMLKRKDSVYEYGRKRGNWWKWKIEPLTIDGVLLYAQKGHGRRAGLYSDYTFAVWNEDNLVPFAKAYTGLTDKEMRKVDAFIKKNTQEKFGPVRTVKPDLVFELAFEGINNSSRHKSGVALRFPRISRWRLDKKPREANSLQDLQKMLQQYG